MNTEIEEQILKEIRRQAKYLKSNNNKIAQKLIQNRIDIIQKLDLMTYSSNKYIGEINKKFGAIIYNAIDRTINKMTPTLTTRNMLYRLAIEAITRAYFSSFQTGIVIAGFGDGEICPSLERFEMEGIINGRLKYVDGPAVDIGRKGPYADVIGFAQRDMIDRFLHGV
jgi:hypothetical protein